MSAVSDIDQSTYKDRYALLLAGGAYQVLLGLLCLALTALMGLGMFMMNNFQGEGMPEMSMAAMVPALLVYGAGALWFLTMGIGSMIPRRWARDLTLVTSWIWLLFGAFGFIMMAVMGPGMFTNMKTAQEIPPEAASGMYFVAMIILGIIYLLLPAILLLLYSGKNLKATLEQRDPKERWTSRCPLPVLAVVLLLLWPIVGVPMMAAYNWTMPVFGHVVSGPAGAAIILALSPVLLLCAWGYYRLDKRAWLLSCVLLIVGSLSMFITALDLDLAELYKPMGIPPDQLEMSLRTVESMQPLMLPSTILMLILSLGYLFYIRRYFNRVPAP